MCTSFSVVLLMLHMLVAVRIQIIAANGATDIFLETNVGSIVLWTGFAPSFLSLIPLGLWWVNAWRIARIWEQQEERYGSFDMSQRHASGDYLLWQNAYGCDIKLNKVLS